MFNYKMKSEYEFITLFIFLPVKIYNPAIIKHNILNQGGCHVSSC